MNKQELIKKLDELNRGLDVALDELYNHDGLTGELSNTLNAAIGQVGVVIWKLQQQEVNES